MTPVRRTIAIALAVVYGLSISASMVFHNHGVRCGRQIHPAAASLPLAGHSGCGAAAHPGHPSSPSPALPSSGDEDNCSVCHFLGQKPIPTAEVIQVASAMLVGRSVRVEPIRFPAELPPSLHSRAPPAAV